MQSRHEWGYLVTVAHIINKYAYCIENSQYLFANNLFFTKMVDIIYRYERT